MKHFLAVFQAVGIFCTSAGCFTYNCECVCRGGGQVVNVNVDVCSSAFVAELAAEAKTKCPAGTTVSSCGCVNSGEHCDGPPIGSTSRAPVPEDADSPVNVRRSAGPGVSSVTVHGK